MSLALLLVQVHCEDEEEEEVDEISFNFSQGGDCEKKAQIPSEDCWEFMISNAKIYEKDQVIDVPFEQEVSENTEYYLTLYRSEVEYMPVVKVNNKTLKLTFFEVWSYNKSDIGADFFNSNIGDVKSIEIELSNVETLAEDTFKNTDNLAALSLNTNELKNIPSKTFSGLTSLVYLDLSRNSALSKIDPLWFETLEKLKTLKLSRNNIESLPAGVFDHLLSLEELDLKSNSLKTITNTLFLHNTNLRSIDLELNDIAFFEKGAFSNLKFIEEINFNGNECGNSTFENQTSQEIDEALNCPYTCELPTIYNGEPVDTAENITFPDNARFPIEKHASIICEPEYTLVMPEGIKNINECVKGEWKTSWAECEKSQSCKFIKYQF